MKMTPMQAEMLDLMAKLQSNTLTQEDCARITAISREMNRLNPAFEIIEFEENKD